MILPSGSLKVLDRQGASVPKQRVPKHLRRVSSKIGADIQRDIKTYRHAMRENKHIANDPCRLHEPMNFHTEPPEERPHAYPSWQPATPSHTRKTSLQVLDREGDILEIADKFLHDPFLTIAFDQ